MNISALHRKFTDHQSYPRQSRQDAFCRQWRTIGKGRNAALAAWDSSLRASLSGHAAALHSLELATVSPALVRLAAHPVQAR